MSFFGELESGPIPDVVEPFVAYKLFREQDIRLVSGLSRTVTWKPGEFLTATCDVPSQGPFPIGCIAGCSDYNSCDHNYIYETSIPCNPCPGPNDGNHGGLGCGIYSYKDPLDACRHGQIMNGNFILGRVLVWGITYLYEKGYRSQYARVDALYTNEHFHLQRMPEALAREYGVDLLELQAVPVMLDSQIGFSGMANLMAGQMFAPNPLYSRIARGPGVMKQSHIQSFTLYPTQPSSSLLWTPFRTDDDGDEADIISTLTPTLILPEDLTNAYNFEISIQPFPQHRFDRAIQLVNETRNDG